MNLITCKDGKTFKTKYTIRFWETTLTTVIHLEEEKGETATITLRWDEIYSIHQIGG